MKTYVAVTSTIFGLLAIAHLWRVYAESTALARDPWYALTTALAAALCLWGVRLVLAGRRRA